MSSATFAKRFTYTDAGTGDDVQTRQKRFTYRDPLSVPPLTFTYVTSLAEASRLLAEIAANGDPDIEASRLLAEIAASGDPKPEVSRLFVEVIADYVPDETRKPKFFTYLIPD